MERLVVLQDEQWSKLEKMLPSATKTGGRNAKPHRLMVEAMLWILRTGAPWRDLPSAYGPWQSVYTRFSRWRIGGVLAEVFDALTLEHDPEGYHIDATIMRAHQDASGGRKAEGSQAIGRSRGGPSTKVHAVVDALGNPVRLGLSEGQTHEVKQAGELLGNLCDAYVAADRAYDADSLVEQLHEQGCEVVIPSKANRRQQRTIDWHLYRERYLVENFFQRIKRFRRLAMRFEKLAESFKALLHLASILIWLR